MDRICNAARCLALVMALFVAGGGVALAQNNNNTTSPNSSAPPRNETTSRGDRDFNWGWLGLIGLAGLAPLFMRRNGDAYRSGTGTTGSTGSMTR